MTLIQRFSKWKFQRGLSEWKYLKKKATLAMKRRSCTVSLRDNSEIHGVYGIWIEYL